MAETDTPLDEAITRALDSARAATEAAEDAANSSTEAHGAIAQARSGQRTLALLAGGAALGGLVAVALGTLVHLRATGDLRAMREATTLVLVELTQRVDALDQSLAQIGDNLAAVQGLEAALIEAQAESERQTNARLEAMAALQPQMVASAEAALLSVVERLSDPTGEAFGDDPLRAEIGALMGEVRRLQATLAESPPRAATPTAAAPRTEPAPQAAPAARPAARPAAATPARPARDPFAFP